VQRFVYKTTNQKVYTHTHSGIKLWPFKRHCQINAAYMRELYSHFNSFEKKFTISLNKWRLKATHSQRTNKKKRDLRKPKPNSPITIDTNIETQTNLEIDMEEIFIQSELTVSTTTLK